MGVEEDRRGSVSTRPQTGGESISEPGLPLTREAAGEFDLAEGSSPLEPPEEPSAVRVRRRLRASLAPDERGEDFAAALEQFGNYLLENKSRQGGGGGGGDGPSPGDVIKKVKSNTWVIAALTILFGSGGIGTMIYVSDARSKSNHEAIIEHADKPMHDDAKQAVDRIERDVKAVGAKVDRAMAGQQTLIEGIESLKREAQTDKQKRLEEKVRELEREKRRLERNR